ncbi:MAG: ATP-binding protein [Promethearchaeia archaeon]
MKEFDLNIEEILEDWEIYHGIREIIANALDEQKITNTKDIEIYMDNQCRWHIRDYGRGLNYVHLTQKENKEKLQHPNLIGKFGIGLKDALATFYRNGVDVLIKSKYGDFTIKKSKKHGFEDILTLHAVISPPSNPKMEGTDVILKNVSQDDIDKAKNLFLKYSGEKLIESTNYGEVYKNTKNSASIYINGIKVAEEDNFLFNYNITSLTKEIKNALNRERTNVGRNAYRERIKKILLNCKSKEIAEFLAKDLKRYEKGTHHDELNWIDIQQHAVKILNSSYNALFLTSQEIQNNPHIIDDAKSIGLKIITIPNNLRQKIRSLKDLSGNSIRDINQFIKEDNESFKFKFVRPDDLTLYEKEIFNLTNEIFKLINIDRNEIKSIKISETMRKDLITYKEVDGLINGNSIIIKRSTLKSLESFSGVLIHEIAHFTSKSNDITREFENELTNFIGILASKLLRFLYQDNKTLSKTKLKKI